MSNDFWDYDKQVDLEGFTVYRLYQELSDQSNKIVKSIDEQKDQTKALYQKISGDADVLKGMWCSHFNLKNKSEMATPEELQSYEYLKQEVVNTI